MKINKYSSAIAMGVMFLLSLIMLLTAPLYLKQVEEMSIFLPTAFYFDYCMELPGGILTWIATYLTQFFYQPWIGATIYAALCALLTIVTCRAFGLKGWYAFLSVVPASMALLTFMSLGYIIFSLKAPGFAYTTLLGLTVVALAFWAYRSIKVGWVRSLVALAVACTYAFFGAYALFAALLCVVHECRALPKAKVLSSAIICLTVAAIIVVPRLWFALITGRLMLVDIYTVMLPRFTDKEVVMWLPYVVAAMFMIVMAAFGELKTPKKAVHRYINTAISVLALVSVVAFSYRDANFKNTLAMKRAISDQDWVEALEIAAHATTEPTRLNCMLAEIALIHTGELCDKLFSYPVGAADYNTTRSDRALLDAAAPMIYYNFGQVNLAYRWAMEMMVEHGMRVEYLKYLAKSALLNGEYELARKYLTTLSMTKYHKPWAEKYLAYADNPKLMADDKELTIVHYLSIYDDHLGVDSGGLELYLRPLIATSTPKSDETLSFTMMNALVARDLQTFIKWLPVYLDHGKKLPRHFQEAIMMWCYVNDSNAYTTIDIDQLVVDRFGRFVEAYQRCQNMSPQAQKEYMYNSFGDTFWYYFTLLEDLKVL